MEITEQRATRGRTLDTAEQLRLDRARAGVFSPSLLRQARLAADIPQAAVASALGVKLDLVRQWETGARTPSGPSVLRLCIIYDISPAYLLDT